MKEGETCERKRGDLNEREEPKERESKEEGKEPNEEENIATALVQVGSVSL